jgi:DNA-binding winged helix-turn-helix (wHTH) protein
VQFHFSNHVLDAELRELTRGGESVPVEPQVFDLLLHLIENRDHVVSKDDLIETVWDGRIVSESTLTSRINAARKAVGDSGKDQAVIRTLARKGFRFVGNVQAQRGGGEARSACTARRCAPTIRPRRRTATPGA